MIVIDGLFCVKRYICDKHVR